MIKHGATLLLDLRQNSGGFSRKNVAHEGEGLRVRHLPEQVHPEERLGGPRQEHSPEHQTVPRLTQPVLQEHVDGVHGKLKNQK